jgi:hypothetical protein
MAIQPAQPQTIGGVLDVSFRLYKASIASVWQFCLIMAVGGALPSLYLLAKRGAAANPADPNVMLSILTEPGYWLTYVFTLLFTLCGLAAIYMKLHAIGTDSELSTGDALKAGLRRTLPLFFMSILFGFVLMIGFVLLLVPGFILVVSLMLSYAVMVIEGAGPLTSLTTSHRLVWGNWWRCAAIATIGFFVILVIYMAVVMVIALGAQLAPQSADSVATQLVTTVLAGLVVNMLAVPFSSALQVATYWDMKLRKEGGDLAARVGALGAA